MDTKKVFIIIGILLDIISALLLIFGYRIREMWPITTTMYEIGIPTIIGIIGITFFALGGTLFIISFAKKKTIE